MKNHARKKSGATLKDFCLARYASSKVESTISTFQTDDSSYAVNYLETISLVCIDYVIECIPR